MTRSNDDEFSLAKPQILFELARGGMGSIHLGRVVGLGGFERFFVVKRLNAIAEADEAGQTRFLSEARLAARIHHANVVGTHHVGSDSVGLFMVLDYVEGSSFQGLVDRAGLRGERVSIPVALRIALDALRGLGAVHRASDERGRPLHIVHRDVSLQNILVGRDGIARIADFGIAKGAHPAVETKTGALIGKLLYLPPEYIRQENVDARADLYMLGVTLWCAITGDEPWPAENEAQLIHRILSERVPKLFSRLNEPVAEEIEALVARACHPDPGERFQSADSMAEAIHALDRERGWVANQQEVAAFVEVLVGVDLDRRREQILELTRQSALAPSRLPTQKRRWAAAAVATLGAAVLVALALPFLQQSSDVVSVAGTIAQAVPNPPIAQASRVEGDASAREVPALLPETPSVQAPLEEVERATVAEKVRPSSTTPKKPRPSLSTSPPHLAPISPAPPDQISTTNPYR